MLQLGRRLERPVAARVTRLRRAFGFRILEQRLNGDHPEAAALLAPRRLNFYGRIPSAFEPVREVYRLYEKPDSMHLTMDLEAVLQGVYDHRFASGL